MICRFSRILFYAAASVLTLAGFLVAWSAAQPTVEAEPFSRDIWLQAADVAGAIGDPGCVRGAMALDLLNSKRLTGLSKVKVEHLLGKPAEFGDGWSYSLGQCSGFGWSHSVLVLQFGVPDNVVSARFQHDSL